MAAAPPTEATIDVRPPNEDPVERLMRRKATAGFLRSTHDRLRRIGPLLRIHDICVVFERTRDQRAWFKTSS